MEGRKLYQRLQIAALAITMEYSYKLNRKKKKSLGENSCSLRPDHDMAIVKIVEVNIRKFYTTHSSERLS